MIRRRFSEFEIHKILQQYEEGASVQDIIEEHGISQATFYNWRAKYGRISSNDILKLNKLKEDNERLKRMFAEISLENESLKAQLKKRD
ncbi:MULTISPECIES: transposase [Maribellus]|uniref:Transposase n=1 Tax=Maribellus comscasis TaxID=2681766 RepID=A0A6I6JM47_9BACT|nr:MULTISPECIES: transposase [Maribellus]MCG6190227.1 transposase [Maribellus maritimus]QGY43935.1 transposase [Maribellus comscasis]